MKFAIVFYLCHPTRDDDLMLVVVLVARRESAGGHRVVTHGKGRGAVAAANHQAHPDPLNSVHLHQLRLGVLNAPLEHGWQGSGYGGRVAKLRVKGFALGDWQTNCWLVYLDGGGTRRGWIIDPGDRPEVLLKFVAENAIAVEAVLFTHAHLDHIMGLEAVIKAIGEVPIYAHPLEHGWFGDPQLNLSAFAGVPPVSVRPPTHTLEDGDELTIGATSWRVLHTPGHSPGSVSLYCADARVAIVGDTLFAGSIGRSDFPSSDSAVLMDSLRRVLMALPDDCAVHPGHGPITSIGRERTTNPWITGSE